MTPTLLQPVAGRASGARLHILERPSRLMKARSQKIKRAMDVAVALVLGVLALPLIAVIAAAILLESGGPVLFAHMRVGKGGRRFRLWKFRTMVVDGEEILRRHLARDPIRAREWALSHKLRNDPRVTRVGRLLRTTSLDELPQLWNVLRGDMSMVGPRPVVDEELNRYADAASLYLRVRPGLTGLWQVSGRNDTTYTRRVELDKRYIRSWSPALDALVLLKTVRVVIVGKGAY
ncbi:MAG TPA: sugar transferase [Bryobacteraceae bacterium]|nr:sugar transferase [Bryobacteraceae bacterium]